MKNNWMLFAFAGFCIALRAALAALIVSSAATHFTIQGTQDFIDQSSNLFPQLEGLAIVCSLGGALLWCTDLWQRAERWWMRLGRCFLVIVFVLVAFATVGHPPPFFH